MLLLGPIVNENGCWAEKAEKRGFLCWKEKIMLVKLEHEKKSQWRCGPIAFSDPSKDKTSVCYHNRAASP